MKTIKYSYLGLDLSQPAAAATLAVIDLVETIGSRRDPVTFAFERENQFCIRGITRFPLGTPLTEIPSLVRQYALQPPPGHLGPRLDSALAVDAAGRGIPVVELLRQAQLPCGILRVVVTGGGVSALQPEGYYATPRRELAGWLKSAIRGGRLVFPVDLPLRAEFEALDPLAGQSANDDMALAVALALWASTKRHPGLL